MLRLSFLLRAIVFPLAAIVTIVVLVRPNHVPLGTVWLGLAVFVLLADLATLAKGWPQNLCITLATLALGLTAVEGFALWRLPRIVETETNLWARDLDLGYRAGSANVVVPVEKTVDGHLAFRASYSIDDARRRLTRSPVDGPKVRFFGDSYTFGEGVDDKDTLPQLFADMSGANVLNFGYPGYSPAQALRALELGLYDRDLASAKLFILQTAPFHIERTSCMPDWAAGFPRYAKIDGQLKLDGRCPAHPWQASGIYQMLLESFDQKVRRKDVDLYIDVVDAFVALAKLKYHVDVLVLDMSSEADELRDTGLTPTDVEARFRAAGAMVVDDAVTPKPGDVMKLPYDGHPTGAQNRLLARKLVGALERERPGLLAALSSRDER